ncbi:hypothetical protein HER32_03660 [Hymenobacter sp. BT18]|uniref:putative type IX secretion system sortase PorU2 n=1 Tax=Hymenobacter sp. BT18 TaxID=2835648 RepID=UPI00143EB469|nr:C25 family cysteine peptidase [Hymenobacter sp. BT18]QIX60329.1 hypothetical protein HER32_03660 [Hymenobacter sp. BT18]
MDNSYTKARLNWGSWLLLLCLLLPAGPLLAQSGTYGNEWIVSGQPYYKIRIARDGIYRLDNDYLTKAGISGVKPEEFQLWRRGKEVPIYVGGSQTTLDATTFIEFFGQRNDGQLDRPLYKKKGDQPHALYSMFTDTAAYFLTWKAGTLGKRMAEPAVEATVAAHPYRIQTRMTMYTHDYLAGDNSVLSFQAWAETGEAYLSGQFHAGYPKETQTMDSIRNLVRTGPLPQLDIVVVGSSRYNHVTDFTVIPQGKGTTPRALGSLSYKAFATAGTTYDINSSEIGTNGKLDVNFAIHDIVAEPSDRFRIAYFRLRYPQVSRWGKARAITFQNDSTLAGPAYYALDSIPATARGYDITDPYAVQRITGVSLGENKRGFVFPSADGQTRKLLIADSNRPQVPLPARQVSFRAIEAAKAGFIIISHPTLMKAATDVTNPVRAYAEYRASVAGGKQDTLVVTAQQLYDLHHYGESSPLGVRRFVKWLLAEAPRADRNLLLLGRGLQTGERGNVPNGPGNVQYRQYEARLPEKNLVPASTRAASDIFFSANWETGSYLAEIPTGRIPARTSQEVANYLAKLKEYEQLGNEPWRKNILHLSGGEDEAQFLQFRGYVDDYKALAERPLFGGKVVRTITRTTIGKTPVNVNIADELNAGLSLITYFGHGSPTEYDLNLGNPNDPVNGYNNQGKYPVFLINGCAGGNSFIAGTTSVGENWLLAPQKGAIGFLADSDFGYENQLDYYCNNMYRALFNDPKWYGKPVPVVFREVAERVLAKFPNDPHSTSLVMNTIWQGDPLVHLYAPEKPDYYTSDTQVKLLPGAGQTKVDANSASFRVQVGTGNLGKWTTDPVTVTVTRAYPASSSRPNDVLTITAPSIGRDTLLTFNFDNTGNVFGQNTFTVAVDAANQLAELNENNNQATLTYNFLQGGITLLSPGEFAIVSSQSVHLIGQNNNPLATSRVYEMELDTVPTFNSPARLQATVTASVTPDWRPTLPAPAAGQDSVVYYWRMRFQTPAVDEEGGWSTSSFRVIPDSPGGWSQSHYGQFDRDDITGLSLSRPGMEWKFESSQLPLTLRTAGGGTGNGITYNAAYGAQLGNDPVSSADCGTNLPNLLVVVYNPRTLSFVSDIAGGPYQTCGLESSRYYHFAQNASVNINAAAKQAQLLTLLNNVPKGYYVAVVSLNRVRFSTFSADLKAAFNRLGSKVIDDLKDGDPFVLIGQQGLTAGQAQEAGPDLASTTPRTNQVLVITKNLQTNGSAGQITSTRIGPAKTWGTLYYTLKQTETSSATFNVIGLKKDGTTEVVRSGVTASATDLSTISAEQYPYLQLQMELKDEANRQAPQLKQWLLTYTGIPEGIVRRDLAAAGSYDNLDKQAETGLVQLPVVFQNASMVDFAEKVKAVATIKNGSVVRTMELESEAALKADATVTYLFKVDVADFTGATTVKVVVNPQLQPELYYFNNELEVAFNAPDKNLPPTLDVAFDGQHILNGDIVSPTPIITAVLHDDDTRRTMQASNFEVLLLRPGGTFAEPIDMNSPAITFKADAAKGQAQIDYRPEKLDDGIYKLQVQGKDVTGTKASTERYEVTFEVVNASTITNVYPFPNPVTSKTRFVFTMTGAEMPRDMKIQIMSLTGKVVREISMAELGPLHIGNNVTEYAWDGTDEFGDKLANGTYLYRVLMDKTTQFDHRRTDGDKAFKKDWGKLVLLR